MGMDNSLSAGFEKVLRTLLDQGFRLPVIVATVARNGSVSVCQFKPTSAGGFDCKDLCEHTVGGRMYLPINTMWVDADGQAQLVDISEPGPRFLVPGDSDRRPEED